LRFVSAAIGTIADRLLEVALRVSTPQPASLSKSNSLEGEQVFAPLNQLARFPSFGENSNPAFSLLRSGLKVALTDRSYSGLAGKACICI